MSEPNTAVVITCFELGRTLPDAIASALSQRRPVAEIVVVDDGSADPETVGYLDSLNIPKVRTIRTTHQGVAIARNRGVAETSAPYIVLLDGDDVLDHRFTDRLAGCLDRDPSLSFVSCGVQAFEGAHYVWIPPAVDAVRTLTRGSVHISSMFRRELWTEVGGFDDSLEGYEDLDFWLRAIRLGMRGEIVPEPLLRYRVRSDSRYRRALEPERYVRTMRAILARHQSLLQEQGVEILLDKQDFLLELRAYRNELLGQRDRVRELKSLPSKPAPRAEVATPEEKCGGGLVLAYHRIATLTPDSHQLCVSPENFRSQLHYLKATCVVLRLEDLVARALTDTLPARAVALTFDDGYLDALGTAAPILADLSLPATFFVNSQPLREAHEAWHDEVENVLLITPVLPDALHLTTDTGATLLSCPVLDRRATLLAVHAVMMSATKAQRDHILEQLFAWSGLPRSVRSDRRLLTRDEVAALARIPGCEIGSHSAHHLQLTRHDNRVQRTELLEAQFTLEAATGHTIRAFAYPFGDYDVALQAIVRQTDHHIAVTVDPGLVNSSTDPMSIPRTEVPDVGGLAFEAFVADAFGCLSRSNAAAANRDLAREEHHNGSLQLRSRPVLLIADPTSKCNARCVMCHVSFRPPHDRGVDLPRAVFERLLPLTETAAHINLFASGEPTIAPEITRMIASVRKRVARDSVVWLSTNGKRLPDAILDLVMVPGFGLQFSVDGGTRKVFEEIRRGIRFDELCGSLERVRRRKGSRAYPRTAFSSTVSKRNLHDLVNIFGLAKQFGIEHVHFYEEDPEVPEEEAFLLDEGDLEVFQRQLPEIEATGVSYSNELYFRGRHGLLASEMPVPRDPPAVRCKAPWHVFHARADGSVRTCCTLRKSMGDLTHQSIEEVWNGPEYVALRQAFITQTGIPGTCYRCVDPLKTFD